MSGQGSPRNSTRTETATAPWAARPAPNGWRRRAVGAGLALVPLTGVVAGAAFAAAGTQASTGAGTPRVVAVSAPAEPQAAPSALAAQRSRTERSVQRALRAFAAAGYTYDDAADLAYLWHLGQPSDAKVRAGRWLIGHRAMPLPPSEEPTLYWQRHQKIDVQPAVDAFLAARYSYDDAFTLASLWQLTSYEAKVKAGTTLLRRDELPITPGEQLDPEYPAPGYSDSLKAYAGAGYDYDDALVLASYWNTGDPFDAKVRAGGKLINGFELPIQPGGQLTDEQQTQVQQSAALDAYFGAGYDYDDALVLADLWLSADAFDAKITAGTKLAGGLTLPIRPGQA